MLRDFTKQVGTRIRKAESGSGQDSCAICLDEFNFQDNHEQVFTIKKCGHSFHIPCFRKYAWALLKNNLRNSERCCHVSCPLCRDEVITLGLKDLESFEMTASSVYTITPKMLNN